MLTENKLREIQRRIEQATPDAPNWKLYPTGGINGRPTIEFQAQPGTDYGGIHFVHRINYGNERAILQFIAHARRDVPAMLATIRKLQAQVPQWTWWETAWPDESGWYVVETSYTGAGTIRPFAFFDAREQVWSWDGSTPMRPMVTHWAPIPQRQVLEATP